MTSTPSNANFSTNYGTQAYVPPPATSFSSQNYTPSNANYSTNYGTQAYVPAPAGQIPASGPTTNFQSNPTNYNPAPSRPGLSSNNLTDEAAKAAGYQNLIDYLNQNQGQYNELIDSAFNSRIGALNESEQTLRGQFPGIQSEIEGQFGASQKKLDAQRSAGERDIQSSEQKGAQRREDALSAARRLFNELVMGGNQRFGGSTSAGEAYQALSGRELQRNRAQTEQEFSNFMSEVNNARTSLNENYASSLEQLEVQKNTALGQARRDFESRLSEINRLKAEAEGDKANQRLAALQDYRNKVFEIQTTLAELRQNVDNQATQASTLLDNYQNQALQNIQSTQQAGNQFQANTTTSPQTGLDINQALGSGGLVMDSAVGNINTEEDQEFLGSINPFIRTTRNVLRGSGFQLPF